MTKRIIKSIKSKKTIKNKRKYRVSNGTRRKSNYTKTRKVVKGGFKYDDRERDKDREIRRKKTVLSGGVGEVEVEVEEKSELKKLHERKEKFRNALIDKIIQINNKKNINEALKFIMKLFENNEQINTLVPVTRDGKSIKKLSHSPTDTIYDFVSPINILFDNLTGKSNQVVSKKDLILLLQKYWLGGGNFNNLSQRFKMSPIQYELSKNRLENIDILLDKKFNFHIDETSLDDNTKEKIENIRLSTSVIDILPEKPVESAPVIVEKQAITEAQPVIEDEVTIEKTPVIEEPVERMLSSVSIYPKLVLPYKLPENKQFGYKRSSPPEFWSPLFNKGKELIEIRREFRQIYEMDRYTSDIPKTIQICSILERIVPGYSTKKFLHGRESVKTLTNVNILNCFITLFYGVILYKLYKTNQDYIFIFKGGRAIQLSLANIENIGREYYSEDTDILIVPNKNVTTARYNHPSMLSLSGHIAFLVKWMIPPEINIVVNMPRSISNNHKEITKILYNDDKIYKELSDIGFGRIPIDIQPFFNNLDYFRFFIDEFGCEVIFITPTIDDMLAEKLYYYSKYFRFNKLLEENQPIKEAGYETLDSRETNYYLFKFKKAIYKLIEAVISRDYTDMNDTDVKDKSKLILRSIIGPFSDYSNEEKENIIGDIYH